MENPDQIRQCMQGRQPRFRFLACLGGNHLFPFLQITTVNLLARILKQDSVLKTEKPFPRRKLQIQLTFAMTFDEQQLFSPPLLDS